MKKLLIIGTGLNAEHAYTFCKDYGLYDVVGFAVDSAYKMTDMYLGLPIYEIENMQSALDEGTLVFVALLWNRLNADRRGLFLRLKEQGYHFANLISPHASVRSEMIGENVWIHDFAVIQNGAHIGSDVAIMAQSLVGNNAVIEDHCFLGAKSTVAGGCTIGEQTFVGINCTVFDDTAVGRKCILGACTAVKRNVPDFSLYKTSSEINILQYDENTIEEKLMFKKNRR